ncbi:MAG: HD domain-containing protein, partial [Leptospiraceae bacterium]|nr:HD domain-containing protein [Leptospiraceae bacterium]
DRFFPQGEVKESAVEDARYFLRLNLLGLRAEMPSQLPDRVIGSSGTARTVMELVQSHLRSDSEARDMTARELDEMVKMLLDCKNRKQRESRLGLDEKRSDIIVGGALLLQESFRILGISRMEYSPFALREGVVFDSFHRTVRTKELSSIRKSSVLQLAHRMIPQEGPAEICAALCVSILEALSKAGVFFYEEVEKEILEYAALLHNCGIAIAHSAHHKHSHYIISNTETLLGFTGREIQVMATIARYHRKALPSKKHDEYDDLNRYDRRLVKVLAGILRIAIGLSRGESGRVDGLEIQKQGKELVFFIRPSPRLKAGEDLSLEMHGAILRKDLLENALEHSIDIRIPESEEGISN